MAFPSSILDLQADLQLSGAWTSITSYVYQRDLPTITRGRPDEATQVSASSATGTLNNRDGRFSSRNPLGAYYGSIGRNTPMRWSVPAQTAYLRVEDTGYINTPDSAGLSITGDIEIQVDLQLSSHASGPTLIGKWTSGGQQSWVLQTNTNGTIVWFWSTNGTNFPSVTTTATLPLGRVALKVTFAVATGQATFYTASSIAGPWTLLEAPAAAGATSIFDSTADVEIGTFGGGSGSQALGKIYAAKILSGIGGTAKASPDFTSATPGAATLTDAQGNVWSLQGNAEFSNRSYRHHGEVASWPQEWDPTGTDVYTKITSSGLLRRLGQGTAPLSSALYRGFVTLTGSAAPVAYWPCEDGNASTQIASGIGGPAMQVVGTPQFASDSSFLCSNPLPQLNKSYWNGFVPKAASGTDIQVTFLMHFPTAATDTNRLVRVHTSGTVNEFTAYYGTINGGSIRMQGWAADGSNLFDTGYVAFASGVNGKLFRVNMALQKSGSSIAYHLDAIQVNDTTQYGVSGTLASATVGRCTRVEAGVDNFTDTSLGHIAVQTTYTSVLALQSQLNAWVGETAGARFARLCSEQGLAYRIYGWQATTVAMGAQTPQKLLTLLQECEDADRGMIYEPREVLALGYRTGASLCGQSAAVTLNYANADLFPAFTPTDDDQYTKNDVTVTRANGGSSSRQTLASGAMSTASPPDGVGQYDTSLTINVDSDSQVDDEAAWILHVGTVDEPRYPSIPVNMARTQIAGNATKFYGVQETGLGDFIGITNPPAWLPPGDIKQILAGTQEQLGGYTYVITWHCVPESPYEVGIVGDTVYGRADTDGSTLHANITSGATSMQVDTTSANTPLWTTRAADFPFAVLMGGEQITVTNITGTSSPQTFTITRSVNGVVKAHTAGEAVSLAHPMIVALI